MEPTALSTNGSWAVSSSGTVGGDDTIRVVPSRAAQGQWGTRKYNGFYTCHVTESTVAHGVQIAKELIELGSLNTVPFDWQHALKTLRMIMVSDMWFPRLAYNSNGLCGTLLGHADTFFHSPRLVAHENGWFVREGTPFRAKIAMTLMREFMEWALQYKGADHIQCGDIANIRPIAVDALYRKLGFKRYGVIYRYGGE